MFISPIVPLPYTQYSEVLYILVVTRAIIGCFTMMREIDKMTEKLKNA
jgi:hypothetical protein